MSTHEASVTWTRTTSDFAYETYVRDHRIVYGSGVAVDASSAPEYKGNPTLVNPEEAFVGALSSCHMLTFLAVAAKKGFVVDRYEDRAIGFLEPNADRRLAMTRVVLRPRVTFSGEKLPTAEELERLHHGAHVNCFIANSVKTEVTVEAG